MSDQTARAPGAAGARSSASRRASPPPTALSPQLLWALAAFAAIAAGCGFYLLPELANLERQIASENDAILALKIKRNGLQARIEENLKLRAAFSELERGGFFAEPKRLPVIRRLEALRDQHRITGLEYRIQPATTTDLAPPGEQGMVLLTSQIVLNIRGYLDRDLIDFSDAVRRELPGHVVIESLKLDKLVSPGGNSQGLIRAASGADLVSGEFTLSWRVVRPAEKAASQ